MKKSKKGFDAVQMMREIRAQLNAQFQEMTFAEQQRYIRERLAQQPLTSQNEELDRRAP